ncbi:MAG TPA: hypothetical protein EYG85_00780 [Crocinitomix sp.]|nr:hypothetical protein [Crocinitomix sp.]
MKRVLLLSTFLIFTSIFFSCKKDLEACIESDKSSVSVGQSITFTSCSTGELSYWWEIKGPATAPENDKAWSDRVFTNTFSVAGSYTVSLKIYSDFSFQGEVKETSTTFSVN